MPPEITKFSDIKLRDYKSKLGCQGPSPALQTKYSLSSKDELFVKYATNTKNMINNAANNQKKLLSVINDLFTFVIDPYTQKKKIRVNPALTDATLQKAVEKARKFIIDLYVKCEVDYVNGVKLYEAIVESKILETTQKQIANLKIWDPIIEFSEFKTLSYKNEWFPPPWSLKLNKSLIIILVNNSPTFGQLDWDLILENKSKIHVIDCWGVCEDLMQLKKSNIFYYRLGRNL